MVFIVCSCHFGWINGYFTGFLFQANSFIFYLQALTIPMFRKIIIGICFLIINVSVKAQVNLPFYPDSIFSTYYHQRVTLFQSLPATKGDIIFVGNSITDGGEWSELFDDNRIRNRGISGDISAGIIHRIYEIAKRKPAKVFLMIGVNDLARNISPDSVVKNISLIISYLQEHTASTKVYVQRVVNCLDCP